MQKCDVMYIALVCVSAKMLQKYIFYASNNPGNCLSL